MSWYGVERPDVGLDDAAVDGTDNQWRAIGQWVTTLEADRTAPSPEIASQVQNLIAGAPDTGSRTAGTGSRAGVSSAARERVAVAPVDAPRVARVGAVTAERFRHTASRRLSLSPAGPSR